MSWVWDVGAMVGDEGAVALFVATRTFSTENEGYSSAATLTFQDNNGKIMLRMCIVPAGLPGSHFRADWLGQIISEKGNGL